jgi:hypothetical protein
MKAGDLAIVEEQTADAHASLYSLWHITKTDGTNVLAAVTRGDPLSERTTEETNPRFFLGPDSSERIQVFFVSGHTIDAGKAIAEGPFLFNSLRAVWTFLLPRLSESHVGR